MTDPDFYIIRISRALYDLLELDEKGRRILHECKMMKRVTITLDKPDADNMIECNTHMTVLCGGLDLAGRMCREELMHRGMHRGYGPIRNFS